MIEIKETPIKTGEIMSKGSAYINSVKRFKGGNMVFDNGSLLFYDDDKNLTIKIDAVNKKITLGTENVKLDGKNKRFIVNDGVNDRTLIGYGAGLF